MGLLLELNLPGSNDRGQGFDEPLSHTFVYDIVQVAIVQQSLLSGTSGGMNLGTAILRVRFLSLWITSCFFLPHPDRIHITGFTGFVDPFCKALLRVLGCNWVLPSMASIVT